MVYAQESTDPAAQEVTISSEAPVPTESPTITPPPDSTPAVTVDPTLTPITEVTPTPISEITLTPSPEPTPSGLSPPTPTPTPDPSLEVTPSATLIVSPNPSSESVNIDQEKSPLRIAGNLQKYSKTQANKDYVEGEVIVKFKIDKLNVKSTLGKAQAFIFEKKFSLTKTDEIKTSNIQVFRSKKSTEELVKELKSDPNVEYAQPNYIYEPSTISTDDTYKDLLWGLDNSNNHDINAPEAWEISEGNGTIVAVIDSGVAYNHPDLINNMWDGSLCKDENGSTLGGCNSGYDYEDGDKIPLPTTSSHGTHIAGTIAAEINNGRGIIGVAPKTKIMAIKTRLTTSEIVKGISFAQHNGAKIINASWGGSESDVTLESAINGFSGVFIAAAGNYGTNNDSSHLYPCDFNLANVICVAATDQNDNLADFSNYSATSVDVAAPGTNIYSTIANSPLSNETFESVTSPNTPTGWIKGGINNNWGTYPIGGSWGNVLYGDLAYPYADNRDTNISSPTYDLTTGGASMSFWVACDTEYKNDGWYDYMELEYSVDGTNFLPSIDPFTGENFRWDEAYLDNLIGDSNQSGGAVYYFENIPIQSQYLTNNFKFRFRWVSNSSDNNYDGCLVDDVVITKFSDGSDEKYDYMQGTSMAVPHVAGLVALIWGYKPNLTSAQVKDRILQTGDTLPVPADAAKILSGKRINAFNALSGLNNSPITNNGSVITNEESANTITLSGSDVDGDTLTYSIVSSPSNGILGTVSGNQVTYTPNLNYFGSDSFTFKASDGLSDSNTSTIFITIDPVNDIPVANGRSISTSEETSIEITLSGSDVDNDLLTYEKVTETSNGTLGSISGNKVTYTPSLNYVGPDSFTFRVYDGSVYSTAGTINITVTAVNDAPILNPIGNKTVDELANLAFIASATDPDSSIIYSLTNAPVGASIASDTGAFNFTPTEIQGPNVYTFTVNVTDGSANDSEEISVTVNEVNIAPVAQDGSDTTNEDTGKTITLNATDSDLPVQTLTYSKVSDPLHGSVAISGNQATYTPTANYNGSDSFTYKVNDSFDDSNIATVTITVNSINDGPVANPDTATINEDEILSVAKSVLLSNDTDTEGNTLTLTSVSNSVHGGVVIEGDNVIFTPTLNYYGSASFDYTISDGSQSSTTTVSITVNSVNDDPVANYQSVSTNEDTSVEITLSAIDVDGDSLIYSIVGMPANGILGEVSGNLVIYTPNTNYTGEDSFTFKADDAGFLGFTSLILFKNPLSTQNSSFFKIFEINPIILSAVSTNTAVISLTINSTNDAPVANSDTATVDEDNDLVIAESTLLSNDTDIENDSLIITAVPNPINGTVLISGGNVVFTPTSNYFGSASFDYTISDGALTSTSTVNITVNSVNDTPTFDAIVDQSVNEDSSSQDVAITNVSSGPENESSQTATLTATSSDTNIVPNPSISGSGTTRTLTYAPVSNKYGVVTITVIADDGQGLNNTFSRTFTITVNSINDAPVANADTSDVNEDQILTIATSVLLSNDTDTEGTTLTLMSVSNPVHGNVVIEEENVKFTPAANYSGSASFDYTVSDGNLTDSTTVTVTVNPINDVPELDQIGNKNIDEFSTLSFTVSATDVDGPSLGYTTSSLPTNATFNSDNQTFIFTPDESQGGQNYQVTFTVSDGTLNDDEIVTITVNEVNSSPVAVDDIASVNEDGVLTINTSTLLTNDFDLDTNTNTSLTVTAVNTAINGTVGLVSSTITFTPNTNFNGSASFNYVVSDGSLTDLGTVNITVNPINDEPILEAIGNKNVNEYDTLNFTVNATDIDNASLNLSATDVPTNATFNTETGVFAFTPDESQGGQNYQVIFTVSDGSLTDDETITISVNEVNNAPVAQDDQFTTDEDSAITISDINLLTNDNDPDNTLNELSVTGVSNPINGTVLISGNDVIFTPTLNYVGPASFEYTVSDGYLTDIATVNITVNAVNDQPVAENGVATTDEDTLVTINLSASDIDNDNLTYSVVSGVSHGVLNNLTNNHIDYTPSTNYFGTDSFTFKANDESIDSNIATVTITVTAVNDSPILNPIGNKSADELSTLYFVVTATDPDNTLIYSLSNEPTGATINSNTGEFSFTPTEAQGPNSYTLTVSVTDGTNTNLEQIIITVNEVNVAPVASNDSISTNEDIVKTITLGSTDSDLPLQTLTYNIVSGVSNGVLWSIVNNQLTYTPSTDYNGVDSFTFKSNDGTADSNTATISITINATNDAPIANPDIASVNEDTDLVIAKSTLLSNDSDIENDTLTLTAVSNFVNGSAVINGDNVVFTPTTNYFGSASFDYTISDGALTSTSTVNITVNPVSDAPVANNGSQTTNEDTLVTIDLSGSDIENDSLNYSIVSGVSNGVLGAISGNQINYTPNTNYNGSDSFTFKVNDGTSDSNTATISITINATNDAPILDFIGNKTTDELTNLTFTALATDPDSSLTYGLINSPFGATINPTTGIFSFTPTEVQGPGEYTFTVNVTDGIETDSEEIKVTVNEVNISPVALDGSVSTNEDISKEITLDATDSDVPTNTLTYSIVSGVGHGVLGTISGNQLTYTPSADYNGVDSFTFKANDGTVDSNTATFTINIDPVNDKPVASSDTAFIDEDTVLSIAKTTLLSNDTDIDVDLLTLSSVSNPVNGSVVIDGTDVKFTPTANYFGSASFDYIVTDGIITDTASVAITVNPVNDSPVANDSDVMASQDISVTIDLSASDIDGDSLIYLINTGVSNGTLGAIVGNQVVYTPDSGYVGSDSFTFLVNDGNIDSNVAIVNITVNPPPVISDEAINTLGETSVTITWTTDHLGTSRVIYDTVSHAVLDAAPNYGYANSTIEADNSPKVTSHTVTIDGLTAGTSYFYRVVSHGSPEIVGEEKNFTTKSVITSGGEVAGTSTSSSSSSVCTDQKPGSAPTLVSAVSYGPNEVTLTWSKAKDPVTYYLVTFGNKSGEMLYGNPSVGGNNTTSYTVRGLSAGSRYYFRVRAGNNCMPGDLSNELSAIVYGETFTEIPEGFLPDVLGEETTTEEVLGEKAPVSQSQEITGPLGGSTRRNIVLAGLGIILIAAGYFFFIKRRRR